MKFRLPRWAKGAPIKAEELNALADLAEYAANLDVDTSSGLELHDSRSGRVLRLHTDSPGKVFLVTTAITTGNGANTPGVGAGTMQFFNAVTGQFVSTPATEIPIYNVTGIGIIVGAYVQCINIDGCWFYDVTACGNGAA